MRIAIIEDEKLTARDLARTIKTVEPDAEILPFIYSVEEAKLFFDQKLTVDLIFSDIELGDGLSFEIFEQFKIKIPIIFCTAYEEYALKAFKNFGIDYIVKPFRKAQVEKALLKYRDLKNNFQPSDINYSELSTALKSPEISQEKSILVYQGDKIIPITIDEIAMFFIFNEKVFALTESQKKYPLSERLEVLEQRFPNFFRANRQFLLNRMAVKDATQYFNRKLLVNLHVPFSESIVVSRLKAAAFLDWLASTPNK